jgi:hypothetical protein
MDCHSSGLINLTLAGDLLRGGNKLDSQWDLQTDRRVRNMSPDGIGDFGYEFQIRRKYRQGRGLRRFQIGAITMTFKR